MESKSGSIFWGDGKEKNSERLELVHLDVCGPTTIKSLGGNLYFVSFIDDASRKTWIYAFSQKSDVYHTFKKWKALVENETWNKIKCLKSQNRGKYRYGGIVKRTPQKNGLAERMKRTIMGRARGMRIHVDLPLQFWVAAADTAEYLIDRSPAKCSKWWYS
ncbi:hypothetical protein RJ640_015702 [Escallonia rubra]|uniref:Integrase catalytic domain-containing protein n=1 Tax=Escallonia rubra TaxID=112253 RepID=A0AA88QW13_9ASTE|nr:hypothetical protein RJ640_015702 [Escallonia rubra]